MVIFYSRKPELDKTNLIPVGRLSGIVGTIFFYLKSSNFSFETNCIEDWEEKLDVIIKETLNQNMTSLVEFLLGSNVF